MKLIKLGNLLVIGLTLSLAAIGCKHRPQNVTPLPGQRAGTVGDAGQGNLIGNGPGTGGEGASATPQGNPGEWANAARDEQKFQADTVHFDYDSSVVKSSEQSKVADVADYLKGNPANGLEIQGHCDERGTDEYNRALGERRALALREELIGLGVGGERIMTISFGRSRPIDTGHTEAAHARNRRGMFVLLTK